MQLLSASTAIVPDDKRATPIELGCIKYVVANVSTLSSSLVHRQIVISG